MMFFLKKMKGVHGNIGVQNDSNLRLGAYFINIHTTCMQSYLHLRASPYIVTYILTSLHAKGQKSRADRLTGGK